MTPDSSSRFPAAPSRFPVGTKRATAARDVIPLIDLHGVKKTYVNGDLAVEVLSPDDRSADVAAKVREYLSHGVMLVWVVDPSARTVTVHSACPHDSYTSSTSGRRHRAAWFRSSRQQIVSEGLTVR